MKLSSLFIFYLKRGGPIYQYCQAQKNAQNGLYRLIVVVTGDDS